MWPKMNRIKEQSRKKGKYKTGRMGDDTRARRGKDSMKSKGKKKKNAG